MNIETIGSQLEQLALISQQLDLAELERATLLQQTAEYTNTFIAALSTTKGYQKKQLAI